MGEEHCGCIQFFRKNGDLGNSFPLSAGITLIGSSIEADIRLKMKNEHLEDIHCIIDVNENGIATLINKSKRAPVTVNGVAVHQVKILSHSDKFEIVGKLFQYMNKTVTRKEVAKLQKIVDANFITPTKRQSFAGFQKNSAKKTPFRIKTPIIKKSATKKPTIKKRLSTHDEFKVSVSPDKKPDRQSITSKAHTTSKVIVSKALGSPSLKSKKRLSLGDQSRSRSTISAQNVLLDPGDTLRSLNISWKSDTSRREGALTPNSRQLLTPIKDTPVNVKTPKSALAKRTPCTPSPIKGSPATRGNSAKKVKTSSAIKGSPAIIRGSPSTRCNSTIKVKTSSAIKGSPAIIRGSAAIRGSPATRDSPAIRGSLATRGCPTMRRSPAVRGSPAIRSPTVKGSPASKPSTPNSIVDIPESSIIKRSSSLRKAAVKNAAASSLNVSYKDLHETDVMLTDDDDTNYEKDFLETAPEDSQNSLYSSSPIKSVRKLLPATSTPANKHQSILRSWSPGKETSTIIEDIVEESEYIMTTRRGTPINKSAVLAYPLRNSSVSKDLSKSVAAGEPSSIISIEDTTISKSRHRKSKSRFSSNKRSSTTPLKNVEKKLKRSVISIGDSDSSDVFKTPDNGVNGVSVVDLVTPHVKPIHKKSLVDESDSTPKLNVTLKSKSLLYTPVTEDVTPVTPISETKLDAQAPEAGFKTPINTPGVFENIRKSVLRSRSRLQMSSSSGSNGEEKGVAGKGVKRGRESESFNRSAKRQRFEESGLDSIDFSAEDPFDTNDAEEYLTENASQVSMKLPQYFDDLTEKPVVNFPRLNKSLSQPSKKKTDQRRSLHTIKINTYRRKSMPPTTSSSTNSENEAILNSSSNSVLSETKSVSDLSYSEVPSRSTRSTGSMSISSRSTRNSVDASSSSFSNKNDTKIPVKSRKSVGFSNISQVFELNPEQSFTSDKSSNIPNTPQSLRLENSTSTRSTRKSVSVNETSLNDSGLIEYSRRSTLYLNDVSQNVDESKNNVSTRSLRSAGITNTSQDSKLEQSMSNRTSRSIRNSLPASGALLINSSDPLLSETSTRSRRSTSTLNTSLAFMLDESQSEHVSIRSKRSTGISNKSQASILEETANNTTARSTKTSGIANMSKLSFGIPDLSSDMSDLVLSNSGGSLNLSRVSDSPNSYSPLVSEISKRSLRTSERQSLNKSNPMEYQLQDVNDAETSKLQKDDVNGSSSRRTETSKVQKDDMNSSSSKRSSLKRSKSFPDVTENEGRKPQKSPLNDLVDLRGGKRLLRTPKETLSPKNYLSDIRGVKKLLQTPKEVKSPKNDLTDIREVKRLLQTPKEVKSPKNDLTDVRGVKRLLKTPKEVHSPKNDLSDVKGVRRLLQTPKEMKSPKNDLTDIRGVKRLLQTPKEVKSPKNDLTDVRGVKRLLRTPKEIHSPKNDLSDVRGVRRLLQTPKEMKSPKNDLTDIRGVKRLLQTPKEVKSPKNELTDVRGVKRLLRTPKEVHSPKNDLSDVRGIKKLLLTPKEVKSPKNDLTDVRGVRRLLGTPKEVKSPKNDLTNVQGVKRLLCTPDVQNSPKNDLSDIRGVKRLLRTPRQQNPPKNDLTDVSGVKKLFGSPRVRISPLNDLSDVRGVKRLLRSPRIQNSPLNDLSDVRGVKQLLASPKVILEPLNDLSNVEGVAHLFDVTSKSKISNSGIERILSDSDTENHEELFDKLLERRPLRTYKGKSLSPKKSYRENVLLSRSMNDSPRINPLVEKWLQEQQALASLHLVSDMKVLDSEPESEEESGRDKNKTNSRKTASKGKKDVIQKESQPESDTEKDTEISTRKIRTRKVGGEASEQTRRMRNKHIKTDDLKSYIEEVVPSPHKPHNDVPVDAEEKPFARKTRTRKVISNEDLIEPTAELTVTPSKRPRRGGTKAITTEEPEEGATPKLSHEILPLIVPSKTTRKKQTVTESLPNIVETNKLDLEISNTPPPTRTRRRKDTGNDETNKKPEDSTDPKRIDTEIGKKRARGRRKLNADVTEIDLGDGKTDVTEEMVAKNPTRRRRNVNSTDIEPDEQTLRGRRRINTDLETNNEKETDQQITESILAKRPTRGTRKVAVEKVTVSSDTEESARDVLMEKDTGIDETTEIEIKPRRRLRKTKLDKHAVIEEKKNEDIKEKSTGDKKNEKLQNDVDPNEHTEVVKKKTAAKGRKRTAAEDLQPKVIIEHLEVEVLKDDAPKKRTRRNPTTQVEQTDNDNYDSPKVDILKDDAPKKRTRRNPANLVEQTDNNNCESPDVEVLKDDAPKKRSRRNPANQVKQTDNDNCESPIPSKGLRTRKPNLKYDSNEWSTGKKTKNETDDQEPKQNSKAKRKVNFNLDHEIIVVSDNENTPQKTRSNKTKPKANEAAPTTRKTRSRK